LDRDGSLTHETCGATASRCSKNRLNSASDLKRTVRPTCGN
jgi:hypothetical protein